MGIGNKIFGAVKQVKSLLGPGEAVVNVLDKFIETPEEKKAFESVKMKILQNQDTAQVEINKLEVQSTSFFKSNWRPAIGWTCAIGIFSNYIVAPYVAFFFNKEIPNILDDSLMELTLGMLGMAALRTFEKAKGRAR